jgi:hypothetical protein
MKNGQKLKLEDAPATPIYIQEVQASKLGDSQGILSFINYFSGHLLATIFLLLHIYVLFLEHLCFSFQFSLVLFAIVYGWILAYFIWRETRTGFIVQNALVLTLIILRVFTFC